MIVDADKHGLPRVLDLVLVNGKGKSDIKVGHFHIILDHFTEHTM